METQLVSAQLKLQCGGMTTYFGMCEKSQIKDDIESLRLNTKKIMMILIDN